MFIISFFSYLKMISIWICHIGKIVIVLLHIRIILHNVLHIFCFHIPQHYLSLNVNASLLRIRQLLIVVRDNPALNYPILTLTLNNSVLGWMIILLNHILYNLLLRNGWIACLLHIIILLLHIFCFCFFFVFSPRNYYY